VTKILNRAQVVAIIEAKIIEKYGRTPMVEIIKAEGWNALSAYYLKPTCKEERIPKKMLEFAGLEKITPPKTPRPPATYRRKEK
jgi:hypothetical protein